jgi:hypothetical protein
MFKNYSLNRMLILFVSFGFAFLALDSLIEHWEVLKTEPMSLVPICFGAIGSAIGLYALVSWKNESIRMLNTCLLSAFLISAAGVYFHLEEDDEEKAEMTTEAKAEEAKEKDKPLLAPLTFGGLAALGLLATSRKWRAETI